MSNLIGIAPRSKNGIAFVRDMWGWHPLWMYCSEHHPDICDNVDYPFADIGDGLDEDDALALATRLAVDIKSGVADSYVNARNMIVHALPDRPCVDCEGTGVRRDEVGYDLGLDNMELHFEQARRLGRDRGWCNTCFGEGNLLAWDKACQLTTQDIREFALFLLSCGGFSIE